MLDRIKKITGNSFLRSVAIVATGTAGAQAISMAFAPLITRLYDPEAFGMLGTFLAVLGVLTPIAALTYPIAIVLPESDDDAKKLAGLSVSISFFLASISAAILFIAEDSIMDMLNLKDINGLLLLIPLFMISSALHQTLNQWLIRKKQFGVTASVAMIQAVTVNTAKAGMGWYHPTGSALIVITTTGQFFHSCLLLIGAWKRAMPQAQPKLAHATMLELAKRHRDFPLFRAPQVLLNSASQGLPVIIVAAFFGAAEAGYLTLTTTILAAPAALIGNSVGNVFYPRAVELQKTPAELKAFLYKTTLGLILIGGVAFFPIVILGPWIFSLVFGAEWKEAGQFARWVALWMLFSLAARPVISMIPVIKIQKELLAFECVFMPVKVIVLYIGVLFSSAEASIALYSLICVLFYLTVYGFVVRRLQRDN